MKDQRVLQPADLASSYVSAAPADNITADTAPIAPPINWSPQQPLAVIDDDQPFLRPGELASTYDSVVPAEISTNDPSPITQPKDCFLQQPNSIVSVVDSPVSTGVVNVTAKAPPSALNKMATAPPAVVRLPESIIPMPTEAPQSAAIPQLTVAPAGRIPGTGANNSQVQLPDSMMPVETTAVRPLQQPTFLR
jgi:hypothetical protein